MIAIDEFQQISDYPEKNIEGLLRTYTQNLTNIRFIFCGSRNAMMINLFSNVKRPFFGSTQYLSLEKIDKEGEVKQLTAQKFISKYDIGTPANERRISRSLIEKELLLELPSKKETTYRVYDVFLSRWIENEY